MKNDEWTMGDVVKNIEHLYGEDIVFELRPCLPVFDPDCVPSLTKNPLRGVDIGKEYELIKQKKSTLPARLRRLVVKRMEASDE